MDTHHADNYFKAMSSKDSAQLAPHLSENVVLLSPVFPEPIEGKDAVVKVLSGLLETIDSIKINRMLSSDHDVAVSFTIRCEGSPSLETSLSAWMRTASSSASRWRGVQLPRQRSSRRNSPIN